MSPLLFNLVDSTFQHSEFAVAGRTSLTLKWNRGSPIANAPTFFTHEKMLSDFVNEIPFENRYGLLFESQAIIPEVYAQVTKVIGKFKRVFTHSSTLLARFDNTQWIPGGGVWIGGLKGEGQVAAWPKSKNVSMLTSNKVRVPLHRKRLRIAVNLQATRANVDIFRPKLLRGNGFPVFDTLRDFRYSIVIENYLDEAYFTEKILNCFATGTVPIYMGARKIENYFNPVGIIPFSSLRQLNKIVLPTLGPEDYLMRSFAVEENLRSINDYLSLEDYLVNRYFK